MVKMEKAPRSASRQCNLGIPDNAEAMQDWLWGMVFGPLDISAETVLYIGQHLDECDYCSLKLDMHSINKRLIRLMEERRRKIPIKAVVFDNDGVIVDSEEPMTLATNVALTRFGGTPLEPDWYHINHLAGSFDDLMIERGVPRERLEEFYELLDELFHQVEVYPERPGIKPIFEYVQRRKLPIYVSSACNCALTEKKIRCHFPSLDFITGIHGGEKKSATFFQIAEELRIEPENILFITDMGRDIEEAQLAGLEYIFAIVSGFSSRAQLMKYNGQIIVDHHRELLAFLRRLI